MSSIPIHQTFYSLGKQYMMLNNYLSARIYFLLAASYTNYKNIEIITSLCDSMLQLNQKNQSQLLILKLFGVSHLKYLNTPFPSLTTYQLYIITKCFEDDLDSLQVISQMTSTPSPLNLLQPTEIMQTANISFRVIYCQNNTSLIRNYLNSAIEDSLNIGLIHIFFKQKLEISLVPQSLKKMINNCSLPEVRELYELLFSLLTRNDVDFVQRILLMKQTNALLENSQLVQLIETLFSFNKRKYEDALGHLENCWCFNTEVLHTSIDFHLNNTINYNFDNLNEEDELTKYKMGLRMVQLKKLDKAIEILKDSKEVEGIIACGYVYSLQKEYQNSIKYLNQASAFVPFCFELKLVIIQQLICCNNLSIAEEELNQLIGIVSTWELFCTIGQLRFSQHRYEDALKAYNTSLEKLGNDSSNYLTKIIYGNIAQCWRKLNNFDAAIEAFNKSLGFNDFVALSGIGWCFYMSKNYIEALKYFQRALSFKEDPLCRKFIEIISNQ
ncbi:hypothetical protein ENUP19_0057G0069 [Entamoeba nuttalli]|uniref:Tetratricopeptide repeat-containing protein n=2 Tax=Entamoeba nuttalli TaxID=412467 RepID=K2GTA3_ENTNP|nr:tetratricopeptide repeat-containing protein [Entamoeba nuttalli P19]EKE37067.1 tetratricopeptide repeat-containing protein [Entamoeba nuttalli P19]|eukprot:XP_008860577.1 tetratricopeptide repeat-containing protein [Entamoeba nuttalli P19]